MGCCPAPSTVQGPCKSPGQLNWSPGGSQLFAPPSGRQSCVHALGRYLSLKCHCMFQHSLGPGPTSPQKLLGRVECPPRCRAAFRRLCNMLWRSMANSALAEQHLQVRGQDDPLTAHEANSEFPASSSPSGIFWMEVCGC